jgi:hypothetical protein
MKINSELDSVQDLRFEFVADLVSYDGPLESLFRDRKGELYLYSWCDSESNYNRWIVLRVEKTRIKKYILGKLSLKDVITEPIDGVVYLLNIDNNLNTLGARVVSPPELNPSYIPDADSYLSFEEYGDEELSQRIQLFSRIFTERNELLALLKEILREELNEIPVSSPADYT